MPFDNSKAVINFNRAAAHQNLEGKYLFAKMQLYGIGIGQRCSSALTWYTAVADRGPWFMNYEKAFDSFLEENYDSALLQYEKLANAGLSVAQSNVAYMLEKKLYSDNYLSKEIAESRSFEYYKLAALLGISNAHLKLGDFYYYPNDLVEISYPKAAAHYRAIGKSNAQALYNLGYMYQYGIGVTLDRSLAGSYYRTMIDVDSDSILAGYLSLANLGIEYAKDKYEQGGKLTEIWSEFWDYMFFPSVYTEFLDQLEKGKLFLKRKKIVSNFVK